MKHAPTFVLALAAAAALLVPVLVPHPCDAQDKPPEPGAGPEETPRVRTTVSLYDMAGIRSPRAAYVGAEGVTSVPPFGFTSPHMETDVAEAPETTPRASQIVELLRSLVPGEVMEHTSIDESGESIVVRSTADGHRRVAQALEMLRSTEGTPYELLVRAATLDDGAATDALLSEIESAPGGVVPEEVVRRALAADRDGGVRCATVAAYDGRWTAAESVRARNVVSDWDVEIAQAASIADPIPRQVEDGLRAAVRAARMRDGRALVSVAAATGDAVEPFRRVELRTKDLGASELPEVRGAWATSAAPMRAGETVAYVLASPVSERVAVRRVVFVGLVSAPPAPDLPATAIVPVTALETAWAHTYLRVPGREPTGSEHFRWGLQLETAEDTPVSPDAVADCVRFDAPAAFERDGNVIASLNDWPGGGALLVQGDQECRDAAQATAARLERERIRAAHLSVKLVARGAAGDRVLGTLSGPALLGRNVAFAAYTSVPYVGDYDVEVAQEARIADPIVMSAVGGSVLNVTLSQGPGASLRADLDLTAVSVGDVETSSAGAAEVGVIERIPVRRARAAQGVIVEAGRPKEIELGANPWGPGRLVAVIRAERVGEK